MTEPLLRVEHLVKYFNLGPAFSRSPSIVHAVDGVSLEVGKSETLAIVGESGCGKSTLGRLIMRLINPTSGSIRYEGTELASLSGRNLLPFRRKLQIIFQDPYGSLNPRMTVQETLTDLLYIHNIASGAEARARVGELLETVALPASSAKRYPHEFSGGQRQRIGIARALAVGPSIIVCDEAVSALDVSVQAQIVNLLEDIQERFGIGYVFISHDLTVVRHMADRVAVMYLGRIIEQGETEQIFARPRHPYTRALLDVIPVPGGSRDLERPLLKGEIPSPVAPPPGCHFNPRCAFATDRCRSEPPALEPTGEGLVACHRWREIAEWVEPAKLTRASDQRLEKLQSRFNVSREAGRASPS
ncbi:MAG TPA: oligopeptide/dipeptide ABC transporter ATP-binding protein [Rhizobiaceae bacterium]|nr:oligopeptide/dipeptide ABC transporter ATP-binding protein [Rhizobiaceae bacterium]